VKKTSGEGGKEAGGKRRRQKGRRGVRIVTAVLLAYEGKHKVLTKNSVSHI
jgi:hypothetical protein